MWNFRTNPLTIGIVLAAVGLLLIPTAVEAAPEPPLMKAVHARYAKLTALRAAIEITTVSGDQKTVEHGTVKLMKPNFSAILFTRGTDSAYISDGKTVTIVHPSLGGGGNTPADPHGVGLPPGFLPQSLFFDPAALYTRLWKGAPIAYKGVERYRKIPYRVVDLGPNRAMPYTTTRIYIGKDHLVYRQVSVSRPPDGPVQRTEFLLTHIDTAPRLTKKDFVYNPSSPRRDPKRSGADFRP